MAFDGFDPAALDLLRELPSFDKARYVEARAILAGGIREPGIALIELVASAIDPALTVDQRSSISPLHTDLLRQTGFQVRFRETLPKLAASPAFVAWCEKRLRELLPVHNWLVVELSMEERS